MLPSERRSVCMKYRGSLGNNSSSCGVIERVILRGVLAKHTRHATRREEERKALEEAQAVRGLARFPAALDVEFAINALHLRLDRIDRDDQICGNLRVGATPGKQAKYALLGFCQWLQQQR